MLREMQDLRGMTSTAEQKGVETGPNIEGLPSKVDLVWVVRNRDELQLLDPQLLTAAAYVPDCEACFYSTS